MPTLRIAILVILAAAVLGLPLPSTDAAPPDAAFRQDQIPLVTQALSGWRDQGLDEVSGGEVLGQLNPRDNQGEADPASAALRSAVIRYAQAQHGQTGTVHFPENWAIRAMPYDAEGELTAALSQDRLAAWLGALPPPFKAYRDLAGALDRYHQILAAGGWEVLTGPLPLKQGMTGSSVKALRERLAGEGYDTAADASADVFDAALAESVSNFQRSHGLAPTGIVNKATRASLNVPVDKRIAQIAANLERWRWLPRDLPDMRVEVNIAAATADLIAGGERVLSMRAIVGRPADETPMLAATINAVVVNPSWLVPPRIAAREILPKAKRDPDFLAREGFVQEDIPGAGRRRLRQQPGDQNALGRIKFDLPNPFGVYLHDTPARQLFNRDRRALSHGCVRLEKPLDLALALLKDDVLWPPERVVQAIAQGATTRITLEEPVPVFLLYWTAFVDEGGAVNFRDDLYGWDERLLHLHEIG